MAQGLVGGRGVGRHGAGLYCGQDGALQTTPKFFKTVHPEGDFGFQQILKGVQSRKIE